MSKLDKLQPVDLGPPAIVVLGMHRSGTSALTGVLSLLGLQAPEDDIGAKRGNATGHWESAAVVAANDRLLDTLGSHWSDWSDLDVEALRSNQTERDLERVLEAAFVRPNGFALKDPRLCRLLPLYRSVLPDSSRIVLIFRDPAEVCASLNARDGLPVEEAALAWLAHVLDSERHSRGLRRAFCSFDDVLKDPRGVLGQLDQSLELGLSLGPERLKRVDNFLDGSLNHHRAAANAPVLDAVLTGWVRETYQALLALSRSETDAAARQTLDEVFTSFDKARPFLDAMLRSREALLTAQAESAAAARDDEIDTLRDAQDTELRSLRQSQSEEVTRLRAAHDDAVKALRDHHAQTLADQALRETQRRNALYSERDALLEALQDARDGSDVLRGSLETQIYHNTQLQDARTRQTAELRWHVDKLAQASAALKRNAEEAKALNDLLDSARAEVSELAAQKSTLSGSLSWHAERLAQASAAVDELKESSRKQADRTAELERGVAWHAEKLSEARSALERMAELEKALAWHKEKLDEARLGLDRMAELERGLAWHAEQLDEAKQGLERTAELEKALAWHTEKLAEAQLDLGHMAELERGLAWHAEKLSEANIALERMAELEQGLAWHTDKLAEAKAELSRIPDLEQGLAWHTEKLAEANAGLSRIPDLEQGLAWHTEKLAEANVALERIPELEQGLAWYADKLTEAKGAITREATLARKRDRQLQSALAERAALTSDNAQLTSRLHGAGQDLERKQKTLQAQYDEHERVLDEMGQLAEALTRLTGQKRDLTSRLQTQTVALQGAEAQNAELQAAVEHLQWMNAQSQHALETADAARMNLLSSTSWRLTRPLREMKLTLRRWAGRAQRRLSGQVSLSETGAPQTLEEALELSYSDSLSRTTGALASGRRQAATQPYSQAAAGFADLPDASLPEITISAVLYNGRKWLADFFGSLEAQSYPLRKIHLHLVNNASTDETLDWLSEYQGRSGARYAGFRITTAPNNGYGAGNDVALRAARTDYVLVTNVDLRFHANTLRRLVSVAVADPEAACWETRQTVFEHPKYYDPVTLKTNWNAHACVLIRRSAYLAVGGYETRLFMYGEDVELSYRFRAHQHVLRYVPSATVTHHVDLTPGPTRAHQLSGSIAANILLRYRYGTRRDILAGESLFRWIRFRETDPVRQQSFDRAAEIIAKHRMAFYRHRRILGKRLNGLSNFPFWQFDYDIVRDGADVALETEPPGRGARPQPLVSVVTRAHMEPGDVARAANLRNAMMSVLNQTYGKIEHVIVEDRTHGAKAVVDAMTAHFPKANVRYLRSPGAGRSDAGNFGLQEARGEYLLLLDDDDMFFAEHVELLVTRLQDAALDGPVDARDGRRPVAAYSLAWNTLSEVEAGEPIGRLHSLPAAHRHPYDASRLRRENFIPIQSICFHRSLLERFGGFHTDLDQLEDWNLWLRYSQGGPFLFVPKVTSLYRTPYDAAERERRQALLDVAYAAVLKRNAQDLMRLSASD